MLSLPDSAVLSSFCILKKEIIIIVYAISCTIEYIFITQSIMNTQHLGNQRAEFLSDLFKTLSQEVIPDGKPNLAEVIK